MGVQRYGSVIGTRNLTTTTSAPGVWRHNEPAEARRGVLWPRSDGDPLWSQVRLLMPMDGTNNSTAFQDLSSNAATCTASGNAKISTSFVKYGTGSASFGGAATDRITVADVSASQFNFTGDFTVEAWIYVTSAAAYRTIVTRYNAANNAWIFRLEGSVSALTSIAWYTGAASGALYNFAATITLNTWHHVAVCRSGSSIRGFFNGNQAGSTQTNSATMTGGTAGNLVGSSNQASFEFPFAGYIDDLRITTAARYTANFTPSTSAFLNY